MLTFTTIGSEENNHHFVLRHYLEAHRLLGAARILFVQDLSEGGLAVVEGRADYLLQCAAGQSEVEEARGWRAQLRVVDAFISPGMPMVLVRSRKARPGAGRSGGAFAGWTGSAEWPVVCEAAVQAVLNGRRLHRCEARVVPLSVAIARPEQFQVIASVASLCEGWLVYGRDAVDNAAAAVWRDSPVARQYWLGIERLPARDGR